MMYVIALLAVCAVVSALLVKKAGRQEWEGALLGLLFGPVGVLVALWMALRQKPASP